MALIENADFFVRYVKLPQGFAGCCVPNDDASFSIYIDPRYPQEEQIKTLKHELEHLRCGHFDVGVDPVAAEEEAERRCG